MTGKIKTIGLLLFIFTAQVILGQSNKEKAHSKGMEAVRLMDQGKLDASIQLLEEAQKLDPESFDIPYELAYANYAKQEYKRTIKILEGIRNHADVTDRLFQLLGNAYDMTGKSDKANETYDAGLQKFPNSGPIYLEKGNVHWAKKEYEDALPYYEKGIEVDPAFPSNYYRAAILFCSSNEKVWGVIYGEIFMNLERGSARTEEISKFLYQTYQSGISITSDTSFSVNFSKVSVMDIDDIKDPDNMKLPFAMGAYEPSLIVSLIGVKSVDVNSLHQVRSNFIDFYFEKGFDKTYPNILFSFQKNVKEAGHFEAYNHWVLIKGDEDAFLKWKSTHEDEWENFAKWFGKNKLNVDAENRFYRGQY